MRYYLSIIVVLLVFFYFYFSYRSYNYYVDRFSENKIIEGSTVFGGDYRFVLNIALANDISKSSFYSGNLGKIKEDVIISHPKINVQDFERAFIETYIASEDDYICIVSCGTDYMKSFTGKSASPTSVCFLEYSLNIKDIVLAKEYYGLDSYLRWSPIVFVNRKNDTLQYFSHLKYLLARERFIRFPEGFNFRAFYGSEFPKRGAFISYHMKEDSWKVLWKYEGTSGENIQFEEKDVQQFINILKVDTMFYEVDSIHFPFYLPY